MNYEKLNNAKTPIIAVSVLCAICFTVIFLFSEKFSPSAPPTEEIRYAVYQHIAATPVTRNTQMRIKGISLQNKKPDVYLVFADVEIYERTESRKYIAQKYSNNSESYWQVVPATPQNLQALGINK